MATKALPGKTAKGSNAAPKPTSTRSTGGKAVRVPSGPMTSAAPADDGKARNMKTATDRAAEADNKKPEDPIIGRDMTASPLAPR